MPGEPAANSMISTCEKVRDFVRRLAEFAATQPAKIPRPWDYNSTWVRDSSGNFCEQRTPGKSHVLTCVSDSLSTQPGYSDALAAIGSEPVFSVHLDRLVGTSSGALQFTAERFITVLLYDSVELSPTVQFSESMFIDAWEKYLACLLSDTVVLKTVIPLPGLKLSKYPLQLNSQICLDKFSGDEIGRCHWTGILRTELPRFPIIFATNAIGIRRTISVPKVVGAITHDADSSPERFGYRSEHNTQGLTDDVLIALRLYRKSNIQSAGSATWADSDLFESGIVFQNARSSQHSFGLEINESDIDNLLQLWRELEVCNEFEFSLHRFNLAFDRRDYIDRVVDLVISAESLFLADSDESSRGELKYRFALRAAKFMEHPTFDERDVFRILKSAYDVRSAIVHGGKPKEKQFKLPSGKVSLNEFTDVVAELMRLALLKVVAMKDEARKLRQPEYWDDLIFGKSG